MTVQEKVANNVLLLAVSRVSMALAIPMFMIISTFIWGMYEENNKQERRISLVEQQLQVLGRIDTKLDALDDRTVTMLQAIARLERNDAASLK